MTSTELETRFTTLEALLLKLTEKKPSALQRFWHWIKPYAIPFILGMILGGFIIGMGKQQAASGGAASPFPVSMQSSGSPLPIVMEKTFALGISGMFATVSTGVVSIPPLFAQFFAQSDTVSFLELAERLGLGAVMAILGYKIIIKIIEVFGPALLAKIDTHDTEMKDKLSTIRKRVEKIDDQISGAPGENQLTQKPSPTLSD